MNKSYEEILEKDQDGNIVLEQRYDGFREESTYYNGKLIRQVTRYPNGIVEIDNYAIPKI